MRRRLALLALSVPAVALAVLAACSAAPSEPGRLPVTPDKDSSRTERDTGDITPDPDSGTLPDGASAAGRVYAHTPDTLYLYEPVGGTLTKIGPFSCLAAGEQVIDIAVDRTNNMYATTIHRFLSVDPLNANCTELGTSPGIDYYPNALSFVPAGTLDPTKEALVGYSALGANFDSVDYVRITTEGTKGVMTKIGDLNASDAGTQYASSGDIISLIQDGNRTYLTVRRKDGTGTDFLAEIDPKNGNLKRIVGDTHENDLFGFGYWAGKGYGFNGAGRIVEINMATGASVVVKTLMEDGGAIPWYGAGVTTQAPLQ